MTTQEKLIKNKLGLLELAAYLKNVSEACRVMGFSRDTFYRIKKAYEEGGIEALFEKSRRKPNLKNRVSEEVERAVVELALEDPSLGQKRVSDELRKRGIFVSPAGVRSIWLRHGLERFEKRLRALEERVARTGEILTERQLRALEKAQEEKIAQEEIETEHVGYLGAQDTYYVGTIKGIGRIYQQTFIDTYSKVAFAKLYTSKHPINSADLLNDRVIPFFEEHGLSVLRILTDRGTEFCGRIDRHEYELFLALNDIEHTKTKAKNPQTNGICERFHRTIKEEFYSIALRRKLYRSLEELQEDLDLWIERYNRQRPHQGKYCEGKTPMETFLGNVPLAKEKMHSNVEAGFGF
ncbi:IS481 family transposase [Thermosulfurimonas dismutans]|uniref:Mobile element protein n=1 Tax=Thermosulfurimonas dismutans TaxID=999894 RepID=A0A179D2V5_9BACT|nr:IS481 family transposase [Thermosulfurimonas dismutans]OAQ20313.1 Mobile element protein [Thermosulfurimonas dismutans]